MSRIVVPDDYPSVFSGSAAALSGNPQNVVAAP